MSDQILRTLDKHDKLGTEGVIALLQKPESEFGADLDPISARLIGEFLDCKGKDNRETIDRMREWFARAPLVISRLRLVKALEAEADDSGQTALDRLLAMPRNEDQTWRDGGRPANIGWALDDIVHHLLSVRQKT